MAKPLGARLVEEKQRADRAEAERDAAARLADDLASVVADLTDDEPCRYDHHGYCQEHGWLTDGVCAVKRARDLLAALQIVVSP